MKCFAIFFLFIICFFSVTAQTIDSILALYSNNFPQEKIHLHTDKETYLLGETVWFKAYLLADDIPTTVSTNLYVDLLDSKGKMIEHKTMPIIAATADSYFTLPDSSVCTSYIIRAYTNWMLNFDTTFIYHKTITVSNNEVKEKSENEKPAAGLQFFAESGNLVSGFYNYVAFKAMQGNGDPYNITAAIKNSKNEFIDSINSVHDGMGIVKFTPQANETYTAEWKDNKGDYRKTLLPLVQTQGILLHAQKVKNDLYYMISMQESADNLQQLTLVATMYQRIVYQAKIKMTQNAVNDKINTNNFPTGILQLTVFDNNNLPLAERIVFINNNDYTINTAINITEKNVGKRGKNKIEIEIPDTLSSNLSLAVYDAGLAQQQSGRNIYTDLLLQGDIKGYVYNANWYFENATVEANDYLDLVMQTNGWRRYNWDKIIAGQTPTIIYPRDNYLNIYGKAADEKQQGVSNKMINLIVQAKDSSKQWFLPITNKEGTFTQSGIIFYDTATVFYKLNNSKEKNIAMVIAKDYTGLFNNYVLNSLPKYLQDAASIKELPVVNKYTQTFITEINNKNPAFEQKAKVLNVVVVKSNSGWHNWKNDPMLKMDEKYTNMFRGVGANTITIDVLHDEMAAAKLDIYNYMIGKVPGLSIIYPSGGKSFSYAINRNGIVFYTNENEIEAQDLERINLEDIAYIKVIDRVGWKQGLPAALCIYLKKGDEWKEGIKDMPSNLSKIKIAGYSPTKEFYSPDYSIPNDKQTNADLRTTLLWQPYILTHKENKKATIVFYNNDITTKIKIVLEGMNEDGKLMHIEKIIE